jgi:hypothetical protein
VTRCDPDRGSQYGIALAEPPAAAPVGHRHKRKPRFGTKWQLLGRGPRANLAQPVKAAEPGSIGVQTAGRPSGKVCHFGPSCATGISASSDTTNQGARARDLERDGQIVGAAHCDNVVPVQMSCPLGNLCRSVRGDFRHPQSRGDLRHPQSGRLSRLTRLWVRIGILDTHNRVDCPD